MNVPKLRFKEFTDEWVTCTINSVAEVISGGTPDTTNSNYWDGSINWFTPSEVGKSKYISNSKRKITQLGLQKSSAKLLPVGTILLSSRATVGESSILSNNEACTNQGFQSLIPHKNINNEFLYYLIYKYKKSLLKQAFGSTFLEISKNNVEKIKINIPTAMKEQVKLSTFLSLLDRKIELQTKKIEVLKLFKKGLLKCEYNKIKNKNLSQLDNIAQIYQPQTLSQKQLKKGVYPVFGANGIIGFNTNFNHKLPQITISCRGENSGSINKTPEYCWINGNSMVINVDNNPNINKDYLKLILESQNLKYLISGSGQPQIVRFDIAKHKIPIISIDEQLIYIKKFNLLDSKLLLEISELKKLNLLKKGLMQNMFI